MCLWTWSVRELRPCLYTGLLLATLKINILLWWDLWILILLIDHSFCLSQCGPGHSRQGVASAPSWQSISIFNFPRAPYTAVFIPGILMPTLPSRTERSCLWVGVPLSGHSMFMMNGVWRENFAAVGLSYPLHRHLRYPANYFYRQITCNIYLKHSHAVICKEMHDMQLHKTAIAFEGKLLKGIDDISIDEGKPSTLFITEPINQIVDSSLNIWIIPCK